MTTIRAFYADTKYLTVSIFSKEGDNKDILYHVCANVFYISDLFDEYEFEKGIEILEQAELECC